MDRVGEAPALANRHQSDDENGDQHRGAPDIGPGRSGARGAGRTHGRRSAAGRRRIDVRTGAGSWLRDRFGSRQPPGCGGRGEGGLAGGRRRRRGGQAALLPGKGLDPANGGFQRLLGAPDVRGVGVGELFLQFVAGEIVDRLAHVLGAVFHRIDHAGNHQRELDFAGSRFRQVAFAWNQVARRHRDSALRDLGGANSRHSLDQFDGVEHAGGEPRELPVTPGARAAKIG